MAVAPIRIFIGSADRSILEQRVLQWSILTRTKHPVDFFVMNGTSNAILRDNGDKVEDFLDARLMHQNLSTPFTFFRYAIPQFCAYSGRAIYIDSDQLVFADIDDLWSRPLDGTGVSMCRAYRPGRWATSVMLFDCEKCRLDLPAVLADIEAGKLTYTDLNFITDAFRAAYPIAIQVLEPEWNSLDCYSTSTKLIHFTNLRMQPWRFTMHPAEELWVMYLQGAYRDGYVTRELIEHAIAEHGCRSDLVDLAERGLRLSPFERWKRRLAAIVKNAKFMTPRQYLYNLRVGIQRV